LNQFAKSKNTTNLCKVCFKEIKIDSFNLFLSDAYLCSNCLNEMNPIFKEFFIEKIKALTIFEYNEKIKGLIYQYKGCFDYELKDIFLSFIKNYLRNRYKKFFLLPIPSSKKRNEERGFNAVIEIFKTLNLSNLENILFKQNDELQHLKNYKERVKETKMFYIENKEILKDKNILIVDDICTTGTSLKNAIHLVKQVTNKKIEILVIAKRELKEEDFISIKDKSFILK